MLGTAAINKQADVIKILLDSGKFNEEEKLNAFKLAITQGNVQEAQSFLGYVKENFHNSLKRDVIGVIVTGLFIATAVMIPSVAGAVVCGVVAVLVAIVTGLHVKNFTLPNYRAMEENKVEHVNSSLRNQEL